MNNKDLNKTKCHGFTLIEVMLAMAVLAIAGTALMGTAKSSLRALSHIENSTIASWVASNQLVEAHLQNKWPPKNNKRDEEELAGHILHWQQRVIKTTDKNMRALAIDVRLNADDTDPTASFMTYIAKDSK